MSFLVPRVNILGVGISVLNLQKALDILLLASAKAGFQHYVTVTGVHGIVESQKDHELKEIHNGSFLSTPDGMPTVWLGKATGHADMNRVYGPDLMLEVMEATRERTHKHFFYGGAEGVADSLSTTLQNRFPGINVVGSLCPPYRALTHGEEEDLYRELREKKPHFFWVGLSTPKQERFMYQFLEKYPDLTKDWGHGLIMIGVGAAFDFNTYRLRQAPYWMQRSGFEWLFRLSQEPKRLAKRYAISNGLFLWKIFPQLLGGKEYEMRGVDSSLAHYAVHSEDLGAESPQVAAPLGSPTAGMKSFPVISLPVACATYSSAVDWIKEKALNGDRAYAVEAANTHVLALAKSDESFQQSMDQFDLILPDGMPLVWALNQQLDAQSALKDRVYGPTLMLECLKHSTPQQRHFFLGGRQETLDKLDKNFSRDYPEAQIAGMYSPPFGEWPEGELQRICDMISQSGANMVWVGLGCPKQERWIAKHKAILPSAVYFGIGAAFAFHAGEVKQAPKLLQKMGMEWLFRLCMEPRRLWRRYFTYNSLFLFHYFRGQFQS